MKTILVPTSGTETDEGVFATALALARSLGAHLDFYHVRLEPFEAALRDSSAHFAVAPAIAATLSCLENRQAVLSSTAGRRFAAFCAEHRIPVLEAPSASATLSAQWLEELNHPEERLLFHARHSDLVVLGRPHHFDLLSPGLIGKLLKQSGRPIVIAPDHPERALVRTIVVGWQETDECARALMASMPLLRQASRVILLAVEGGNAGSGELADLARQLQWNGVNAVTRIEADSSQTVATQLLRAARASEADLLVIGGFGHNALREELLGGVTQDLIRSAELPVLLMH